LSSATAIAVRIRGLAAALFPEAELPNWDGNSLLINETVLQHDRVEVERCELITWEDTLIRFQGDTLY
jgi:hypothetical protein